MNLFPFFQDIEGKIFLIVGGGKVAERKAKLLMRFCTNLLIVAPRTDMAGTFLDEKEKNIETLKNDVHCAKGVCILKREFAETDILVADYVIGATDDRRQNAIVAECCKRKGIPVNIVDDPALCTFFFPSLIKRGSLTIGITTGGSSPTVSRLLRERMEAVLPEETEAILGRMEKVRESWKSCPSHQAKKNANRRALLRLLETRNQAADKEIEEIMQEERAKNWIIATRGSALALAQAEIVRKLLKEKNIDTELRIVSTKGDKDNVHPLTEIGGNGLFIKEVEREILIGNADIAVHSGKDLPGILAEGTIIAGIPKAADARDCLITRKGTALPKEARIGTGSPRRIVQMKKQLPEAVLVPIRGNIDTRLQKLREGNYDGILLAKAGIDRLQMDLSDFDIKIFSKEEFLPAACQGILAVQCRKEDAARRKILEELSDADTSFRFAAERYLLKLLEADCTEAVGTHAEIQNGQITIHALYGEKRAVRSGDCADYKNICKRIADEIRK